MYPVKLIRIGDAIGVVLPHEALARLKCGNGDIVFLTESCQGLTLTPHGPATQQQLDVGREFVGAFRAALKALLR